MSDTCPSGSLEFHSLSVVGSVRSHNEDAVLAEWWTEGESNPLGLDVLAAVADGMGGHDRGEWASAAAIDALKRSLQGVHAVGGLQEAVTNAVLFANLEILNSREARRSFRHPGTTLTVAAIRGAECAIVHVGDSRAYMMRDGILEQLTRDDTIAEEMIRSGRLSPEEAANWTLSSQLVKAVGSSENLVPSVLRLSLRPADILILCTDGLTGMLSDELIRALIIDSPSASAACEALCDAADRAGGDDNISVVLYFHGTWRPTGGPSLD